ncbi:hypothetical protein NMG60_11028285 [Bertholletia excelsa]
MRNADKASIVLFALIFIHLLVCSSASVHYSTEIILPTESSLSRRLLVSVASISASLNKLKGGVKETEESMETSLRKAPPSKSNPKQNK